MSSAVIIKAKDGTTMKIGGRYLIIPNGRAGRLYDVWCNEISPGGHVRLKRCADRQAEWFAATELQVVEVLAEPPACTSCSKGEPLVSVGRNGALCSTCFEQVLLERQRQTLAEADEPAVGDEVSR